MTILYLALAVGILQVVLWMIGHIFGLLANLQARTQARMLDQRIQSLTNRYYQEEAAVKLSHIIAISTTETFKYDYPYGNPPTFGRRLSGPFQPPVGTSRSECASDGAGRDWQDTLYRHTGRGRP